VVCTTPPGLESQSIITTRIVCSTHELQQSCTYHHVCVGIGHTCVGIGHTCVACRHTMCVCSVSCFAGCRPLVCAVCPGLESQPISPAELAHWQQGLASSSGGVRGAATAAAAQKGGTHDHAGSSRGGSGPIRTLS
jgi:hypothetical protein